ncbi:MAG: hypothetical protein NT091_03810 [Candidatus Falkowbacteria bacterium]|nr:hypothetical protein [Candidatus Falkowbacteria bacterium]
MHNYAILSFIALGNFIVEIIYFPIWWYTFGVWETANKIFNFLKEQEKSMAFVLWIKNIGKPMYGEYNAKGIIISSIVRIFQILSTGSILFILSLISISLVILWLVLPYLVITNIIFQIRQTI